MKIASFNINDVNKRLGNLIRWLRAEKPDVVALQELKAADREFPKAAIEKAGYGAVWRGQKTWNGVAILARGCEPIGDSFAHRSYHALTKTIRRDGGRPAGAILGFANRLLQLYRTERPRAVLSAGLRSKRRPTGTRLFRPIRAAAISTTSSSSSLN